MAINTYKITVEQLLGDGAVCKNISVEFDNPACGNITCSDPDENGVLTLQVPDDCIGECVDAIARCNDDCVGCDPVRLNICPCDGGSDCDGCSFCKDNLCVSVCEPQEFCDDGVCNECNESTPCEDPNKECVGGKCECIEGLIENEYGECVKCIKGEEPPCMICTDSGLIPKECPGDQICVDDECVDCAGSGDCGDNEKCLDGECVCEEGYVRDPLTGNCVLEPECDKDSDCPDCEECNQYGNCQSKDCPDGQICVDDECKTPCIDGTDCPDGQGCNPDTGFCEDCEDNDCSTPDCDKILGCECDEDTGDCKDVGGCGDIPCSNPHGCPKGCTCYKGRCVSCKEFPCEGCDKPGCRCISDKCEEDTSFECEDEFKIFGEDINCNVTAESTLEDSCSCTPITLTFKATNVGSSTDNYVNVDFIVEARKGIADTFNQANSLPRLDATSNSNIADNDKPESGTVSFKQVIDLIEIDENDNPIAGTQDSDIIFDLNLSFNDVAFVAETNKKIYKKGAKYEKDGKTFKITRVSIDVVQDDNFDFSNRSGCVYDATNIISGFTLSSSQFANIVSGNTDSLKKFKTIYSDDKRNPIIKWFRNEPTESSYDEINDVFRKNYIPDSGGGVHRDVLYGPDEIPAGKTVLDPSEGGLWSGYGYASESDCNCGNSYDDFGKVKFCEIDDITVDFNSCLTEFEIETFDPCDVNQDLSQWTGAPNNAQVYWEVYVNGSLHGTYQHKDGTGNIENISDSAETMFDIFDNTEPVTSMKIVQRTSAVILCEKVIEIPENEVQNRKIDYSVDCDRDDKYQVSIDVDQTPVDIDYIKAWNGAVSGTFKKSFEKGTSQQVRIVFIDGCEKTITIDPDCCDERTVSATGAVVQEGGSTQVLVTTRGMELPISYVLDPPSGASITGTSTTRDFRIDVDNPVDGSYSLTVNDENIDCGELDPIEVTITVFPDADVDLFSDNSDPNDFSFFSGGDTVTVSVQINSEYVGSTIHYTRTEVANPSSTVNGTIVMNDAVEEVETVSTEYVYSFNKVVLDGVDHFINETAQTVELEEPTVTSFDASTNNACLNEEFKLTIEATPNSTVTIDNGIGDVAIDSQGDGEVDVIPTSVGTRVYTITSISAEGFGQKSVTGFSENVVVSEAAVVSGSGDCAENNPNSDRVLTFEVDQDGGSAAAYDNENTGSTLTVSGGSNGDGTSTYTVTLPSTTTISFVGFEYTNANGCVTKGVQAVPQSCTCPSGTATVTVDDVCQGTGNSMDFEVTQVEIDGTVYSGSQISVEWFEDGVSVSTSNPYSHPTSVGDPAGAVQLGYEVEVTTGAHDGCVVNGYASGSIVLPTDTNINNTASNYYFDVENGGTICEGESLEFSATSGASYQWYLDGTPDGTSQTYTFNEVHRASVYTVSVEVTYDNGCVGNDSVDIFVDDCTDCNVQYVDVESTSVANISVDRLVTLGGVQQTIGEDTGIFTEGAAGDTKNDAIVTAIENILTAMGDTISPGNTEVYWQYIDYPEGETHVRFYVLGSDIKLDYLQKDGEEIIPGVFSSGVQWDFVRDCNATSAPGCTDSNADNYNSNLNGTGLVSITDDGTCFNVYYRALFASDLVEGISLNFSSPSNDIDIILDSVSVGTVTSVDFDNETRGGLLYNKVLADGINGASVTGVKAAYPDGSTIIDDPAEVGDGGSNDYCTSKKDYIVLYWPFGSDLRLDYKTPGSVTHGWGNVYIDTSDAENKSYTLGKCSTSNTYSSIPPYKLSDGTPGKDLVDSLPA